MTFPRFITLMIALIVAQTTGAARAFSLSRTRQQMSFAQSAHARVGEGRGEGPNGAANQTPPATALDRRTADIINDINAAGPARSKSSTAPAPARPGSRIVEGSWEDWRYRTEFFAPTLATAAAIGIAASICGVLL